VTPIRTATSTALKAIKVGSAPVAIAITPYRPIAPDTPTPGLSLPSLHISGAELGGEGLAQRPDKDDLRAAAHTANVAAGRSQPPGVMRVYKRLSQYCGANCL